MCTCFPSTVVSPKRFLVCAISTWPPSPWVGCAEAPLRQATASPHPAAGFLCARPQALTLAVVMASCLPFPLAQDTSGIRAFSLLL